MAKKATETKKNPPDLTLRNLHAEAKRIEHLQTQIVDLFAVTERLTINQELIYEVLTKVVESDDIARINARRQGRQ